MAKKILQTKVTTLSYAISGSATSFQLDELLKLDGTSVSASDIGDTLYGTFDAGTEREEIFSIDGANVVLNSDGTVSVSGAVRGLKEVSPYGTGGFSTDHGAGGTVIFGNNPQLYNELAWKDNDNVFTGDNTFTTNPRKGATTLASNNDDYITKADLLNAVLGSVTTDQVVIGGVAGENLTAGNIVYFKEVDQKWWLADADIVGTFDQVVIAIVQNTVLADANVNILLQGMDKTQTGLTPGSKYYLSNTAGQMSTTPGTTEVFLGWAQTATRFIFDPLGLYQPSSGEKLAMQGTSGTPSNTNRYVTNDDVSSSASADKIVRASGTALPALNGTNLTNLSFKQSYVLGENMTAPVAVYVNPTDGKIYRASSASDNDAMYKYIGILETSGSTNDTRNVTIKGNVTIASLGVASETISEATVYTVVPDTSLNFGGTTIFNYQAFTTTADMENISSLRVDIAKAGAPNNVLQYDLYATGANGVKTGSSLMTKTFVEGDITTSQATYELLSTPVAVKPSTTYILEITHTSNNLSNPSTLWKIYVKTTSTNTLKGYTLYNSSGTPVLTTTAYELGLVVKYTAKRNYYIGDYIYLNDAAGAYSFNPGTKYKKIGKIISSNQIDLEMNHNEEMISAIGLDAVGSSIPTILAFPVPRNTRKALFIFNNGTTSRGQSSAYLMDVPATIVDIVVADLYFQTTNFILGAGGLSISNAAGIRNFRIYYFN